MSAVTFNARLANPEIMLPVIGTVIRDLFGIDDLRKRPDPYALPKIKLPWQVTSIPSGFGLGRFKTKSAALAAIAAMPADLDPVWEKTNLTVDQARSAIDSDLLRKLYDTWKPLRDNFGGVPS